MITYSHSELKYVHECIHHVTGCIYTTYVYVFVISLKFIYTLVLLLYVYIHMYVFSLLPFSPSLQLSRPVCSFQERRVLFGTEALGLTTTHTVHLQNSGDCHAYFHVL